jgi:hypothetical protein
VATDKPMARSQMGVNSIWIDFVGLTGTFPCLDRSGVLRHFQGRAEGSIAAQRTASVREALIEPRADLVNVGETDIQGRIARLGLSTIKEADASSGDKVAGACMPQVRPCTFTHTHRN